MRLDLINAAGERINLTDNNFAWLTDFDGQTTGKASLSSATIGGLDGDIVNNVQVDPRTVVLDLRIKSNNNVEVAKREILRFAKLKQTATLEWTQEDKTLVISGIVESIEMPRWNNAVTMQITLHCTQPYWEDGNGNAVQEINEIIPLHYFTDFENDMLLFPDGEGVVFGEYDVSRTRTFHNDGDVETGVDIELVALGTVTNPVINDDKGHFFGVGYGVGAHKIILHDGDVLRISTHKGNKSVVLNGSTNLITFVKPRSTWIQLAAGQNTLALDSDDTSTNNMAFSLAYKRRYI